MKNRKQHIKMLHAEKLVGWDGRVEPKIVAGRWIENPSGHSALDTEGTCATGSSKSCNIVCAGPTWIVNFLKKQRFTA